MRRALLFCVLIGFLLISNSSYSQTQGVLSKKWYGNLSIGVGGGPTIFYGDLNPYRIAPGISTFSELKYAGSFYLIRQLSHVFALRGQLLYGEIYSLRKNYSNGAPFNQYLTGNIFEYNLNATINFSNLLFRYKPKRIFFIYGTLGVGMSNWVTKKTDLITQKPAGGSGSTKNWTTEWVVPAGLGAYFTIQDKVNLGFEWTVRGVNSDQLDATAGGFPYDLYSFLSLNLVYNFNKRNPVELNEVNRTMRPIVLPMPKVQQTEKQLDSSATAQLDTILGLIPPPGVIQELLLLPVDSMESEDTKVDSLTGKPYSLPWLESDLFYRIQIFSSSTGQKSPNTIQRYFGLTLPVTKAYSEGYYRYYVGEFENEAEANQFVKSLRLKRGLKGAFVVKFINGTRELTHPK